MAKQTKDTRNSDVLQQRVEHLEKENYHLKKSYDQEFKDFFENERLITNQQVNGLILENGERYLIIQDLKDVIVDLNKRINTFDKSENEYNVLLYESNEKIHKLTNDLNICQSANKRQSEIIKELQLENSEVNRQSKFFENAYYACCGVILVLLTAIYLIK